MTVFRVAVSVGGGAFEEMWASGPDFPARDHLEVHLMAAERIEAVLARRTERQRSAAA
ncbi:MAG: hypothetical protein AAFQ43_00460 [Bacteroidota bacterium]